MTRFDIWMAKALYGPQGYYTSPRQILGARGDFTTAPKRSPLLAQTLAKLMDGPVIELGPGDGSLAFEIRNSLGFFQRRKLNYHFVEISPHLGKRQQQRLRGKGTWHTNLASALKATGPHATILSNEFFDAFPVRIFRGNDELFLKNDGTEAWQTATDIPRSTLFQSDWPVEQRLEVPESIREWFQEQLTGWKSGQMISIDYGGTAKEIYHRRLNGTLRAYLHHQRLYPPEAYQNPGRQDLTTDICFDDLQLWGKEIGLKTISYQTQAEFLGTDPDGPDGAFRVLRQLRE